MFDQIFDFIRKQYGSAAPIPLHEPFFGGNEKQYLSDCIDSTLVSSVGPYVDRFERAIADYVGSKYAVAFVNGTQALFMALKLAGARQGTEIICQSLTFVATANAISYTGAEPVFIDVDRETLGMSPAALEDFLQKHCTLREGKIWNRTSGKQVVACLPMHTLGHPCRIDEIQRICAEHNIGLIEDAAESLGSRYRQRHTGCFGQMGVFSFNGNKVITTGGGGMLVTDDEQLAKQAKHLSTTAKLSHPWEFLHDQIGYNFRLPNLNAAVGVAQMEQLPQLLERQRRLADSYREFFATSDIEFLTEPTNSVSNYWLNSIKLASREQHDRFLEQANAAGIMARALWRPLHQQKIYQHCWHDSMQQTNDLYARVVNLPSSIKPG